MAKIFPVVSMWRAAVLRALPVSRAVVLRALPLLLLGGAGPVSGAEEVSAPPSLALPLICRFGTECFLQQYVDHDAGPGAKDYRCGPRSYDGHKGTDFRLATLAAQRRGVVVIAAAGGTVRAIRNDMEDRLIEDGDMSSVKGRECGNGVLIEAPGGWEMQYCHMARGTVAVAPGQVVKSGDRLGLVGLSGDTQFPHLHLSVRRDGHIVDPFAPDLPDNGCDAGGGRPLWSAAAADVLAYRDSQFINAGFADRPVTVDGIENEKISTPTSTSTAFVYYVRLIGLHRGDRVRLSLSAPDGSILAGREIGIDRDEAVRWAFVGKRAEGGGFAVGRYRAAALLLRDGKVVLSRDDHLALGDGRR